MADNIRDEIEKPVNKLLNSVSYLLNDEKERKLRTKLSNKIKDSIFTDKILKMLNEGDFSGLADEQEEAVFLFSMLFPVVVNENDIAFRLYRHKIEISFTDLPKERYIFSFSEGRLTSGLFDSFRLYDEKYVFVISKIINIIPLLKNAINDSYKDFLKKGFNHKEKIQHFRDKELIAEKNYEKLINLLN